jgi:hypothetical protein
VQFNIPKDCFNAGKIEKIEGVPYPSEEETLIPPYTG